MYDGIIGIVDSIYYTRVQNIVNPKNCLTMIRESSLVPALARLSYYRICNALSDVIYTADYMYRDTSVDWIPAFAVSSTIVVARGLLIRQIEIDSRKHVYTFDLLLLLYLHLQFELTSLPNGQSRTDLQTGCGHVWHDQSAVNNTALWRINSLPRSLCLNP